MRALLLAALLALMLAGCAPQGIYRYQTDRGGYTGYAISATELTGIVHGGARVGDVVKVKTLRGTQRAIIVRTQGDAIRMVGYDAPLDIRPGDSGAPVIAVLEGRSPR